MNLDIESLKKKVLSILFIAVIVGISIGIYIYRDHIRSLGGAYGYIGVFLLCFICNATVLAPAPSLIVVVSAALVLNPYLVALTGACGTALGECTGYISGYLGRNIVEIKDNKIFLAVKKYGCPIIFIFALVPLPLFDIVGLASGYLKIKWYIFIPACFLGKFLKMLAYAVGSRYFEQIIH